MDMASSWFGMGSDRRMRMHMHMREHIWHIIEF